MARPKEFDRDEALLRATDVFWEKGYASTSIQDLVDGMGIGRASLYDTFGSKEQLYTEAMERYCALSEETVLQPLKSGTSPRKTLEAFFRSLVDRRCDGEGRSCLIVKAAVMSGNASPDTVERVRDHMRRIENLLYELLRRAREQGEISREKNPRALARFLMSALQGFVVTSSVFDERKTLQDVVRTTLSVLD